MGKVSLDSLPINDVISMYKDINYFYGSEACEYEKKLTIYLSDSLKKFLAYGRCVLLYRYDSQAFVNYEDEACVFNIHEEHKLLICIPFTEEKVRSFTKYSRLFELFNITRVCFRFFYDDETSYDSVYPSNINSIFPLIQEYEIEFGWYPLKKPVLVTRMDSHYNILYKEYKRQYYEKYYPEAYEIYKEKHKDIEIDTLNNDQIYICNSKNQKKNKSVNKKEEVIHHEIIPIDIDKEISNEKEENKPDLYIESTSNFSEDYNESQKERDIYRINKPGESKKKDCTYKFSFIDNNGEKDYQHPILTTAEYDSDEIITYILHLPICKHLKRIQDNSKQPIKLQLHTPPLLKALKEGYFNNIIIFDCTLFIQMGSYPEHKELFKKILATYRFPNVTTLLCHDRTKWSDEASFYEEIMCLITRKRFPKLHIYDISSCMDINYRVYTLESFHYVLPESIVSLIDTLILSDDSMDSKQFMIPLKKPLVNELINIVQKYNITIHSLVGMTQFNSSWKQLNETGHLRVQKIYISFLPPDDDFDNSLMDLKTEKMKHIVIYADVRSTTLFECQIHTLFSINCDALETLDLTICSHNAPFSKSYLSKYFELFCYLHCDTIQTLIIKNNELSPLGDYPAEDEDTRTTNNKSLIKFLSLFSPSLTKFDLLFNLTSFNCIPLLEECINLPLWKNIRDLSLYFDDTININSFFNIFSLYFKQDQLLKLSTLRIEFDTCDFDMHVFLEFIDSFKDLPSGSLSQFHLFSILFKCHGFKSRYEDSDSDIQNVFDAFPSLSFYLHKPVTSIMMSCDLVNNQRHSKTYCDYIYKQLTMKYTKDIRYLSLFIYDEEFIVAVIQLIEKGSFSQLESITIESEMYTRIHNIKLSIN
ncbi:hypothetical protein WA158_000023 [Blastocystis sp. Blastoise]